MIGIASHLKEIVSFISLPSLKEYLRKAVSVLPEDNKMKPIIKREILENPNIKEKELKATLTKLKAIIKTYSPDNRKPFQVTILQPIQNHFDLSEPFIPEWYNRAIKDQKQILMKKERDLSQAKRQIREDSSIPFPKVLANNQ